MYTNAVSDHEETHFVHQGRTACCSSPQHEVWRKQNIFHLDIDCDPNPCKPLRSRVPVPQLREHWRRQGDRFMLKTDRISPLRSSSPSFSHQTEVIDIVSKNLVASWPLTTGSDFMWTCETPTAVLRDALSSAPDTEHLSCLLSLTTRHRTLEETRE